MKVDYRREMKHNYLIIEPDHADYDSYEMRMLASNNIEGLLKFHIKQVDGQKSYYYEITSKQPLNRILQHHSIGEGELKSLIGGIAQILGRLEVYLLQENQIFLDPEYIYVEPERFRVSLCMVPGRQSDFPVEMTKLLQYLLGKADHQDKECVVMIYGLYQESLKENYGMNDLLEIMGRGSVKEEKTVPYEAEPDEQREIMEDYPSETFGHKDTRAEGKKENKWALFTIILIFFAILACGYTGLWFILGENGISSYWYAPLAAACFSVLLITGRRTGIGHTLDSPKTADVDKTSWQIKFEDMDRPEVSEEPKEMKEDLVQTVLLTEAAQKKEGRYLRAVGQDTEDIMISYVPYLIGKQEGLVDYVLNRQTVSRIHVRIDRNGEEYQLTDLNSTNGTSVNGRQLETNETIDLKEGDEVFIANFAYIFT